MQPININSDFFFRHVSKLQTRLETGKWAAVGDPKMPIELPPPLPAGPLEGRADAAVAGGHRPRRLQRRLLNLPRLRPPLLLQLIPLQELLQGEHCPLFSCTKAKQVTFIRHVLYVNLQIVTHVGLTVIYVHISFE